MLQWAFVFMVAAILAGMAGFGGMLAAGAAIAKALFFVLLVLFLFTLVTGSFLQRPTSN